MPGSPELITAAYPATAPKIGYGADSVSVAQPRGWMSLEQHSKETRDQAAALLAVIVLALPDGAAQAAVTAAYVHDVGKAHKIWQDALCSPGASGAQGQPTFASLGEVRWHRPAASGSAAA